jgi:hypothetical protein
MQIRIIAAKCERALPSGAVQAYPHNWVGDVSEDTALLWIARGDAEAIGGEAALSADQLAFLKSFADHAMAEIAAQSAAAGEVDAAAGELPPPAEGEVDQVLEEAAAEPAGLPPEMALDVAAGETPPGANKGKRR